MFDFNGQLLFTAVNAFDDRELWSSNGTTGGTNELVNINPATADSGAREFVPIGTDVFFIATDGFNGEAVWKADTVANTVTMVADVTPTSTDGVSGLTRYGNEVVFFNDSFGSNGAIFRTDGNNAPVEISTLSPRPSQ